MISEIKQCVAGRRSRDPRVPRGGAMIVEIKQHIAQLVETNRAIVRELEASRQTVGELRRERTALREQAAKLQEEIECLRLASLPDSHRVEQRVPEETLREHEAVLRELDAAKAQATMADRRICALATELAAVEQERDEMRQQLLDSSDVMDEVLQALESGPPQRRSYRRRLDAI